MSEHDLSAYLLAHQGLRKEFDRIGAVATAPRDGGHRMLLDDHIDMTVAFMRQHHAYEETEIFPLLIERSPESAADIERLRSEHALIEPAIEAVRDVAGPLEERGIPLLFLSKLVNDHLDDEERTITPLIYERISVEDWANISRASLEATTSQRTPIVLGWLANAGDDEGLVDRALQSLPDETRTTFHNEWRPAYAKRELALYAPNLPE